jgi:hypothetical protein
VNWRQRRKIRKGIAPDPALVGKYKVRISLSEGHWQYSVDAYGENFMLVYVNEWTGKKSPIYGWNYVESGGGLKSESAASKMAQAAVEKHRKETAEAVTTERLV